MLYVCVVYLLYKKWDDIMSFCILKELGRYLYHGYTILVLNIYNRLIVKEMCIHFPGWWGYVKCYYENKPVETTTIRT